MGLSAFLTTWSGFNARGRGGAARRRSRRCPDGRLDQVAKGLAHRLATARASQVRGIHEPKIGPLCRRELLRQCDRFRTTLGRSCQAGVCRLGIGGASRPGRTPRPRWSEFVGWMYPAPRCSPHCQSAVCPGRGRGTNRVAGAGRTRPRARDQVPALVPRERDGDVASSGTSRPEASACRRTFVARSDADDTRAELVGREYSAICRSGSSGLCRAMPIGVSGPTVPSRCTTGRSAGQRGMGAGLGWPFDLDVRAWWEGLSRHHPMAAGLIAPSRAPRAVRGSAPGALSAPRGTRRAAGAGPLPG